MLNFSKINIILIYFIFFIISIFSFLNFQNKDNTIMDKKVNLGLDLQGGSYLLLEINSDSLVEEKIQSKVIPIIPPEVITSSPLFKDSTMAL